MRAGVTSLQTGVISHHNFLYHVLHKYSAQYYYSSVELWCLLFISAALHIHDCSQFQSWFTSMRDDYADFNLTMSDYTSWLPQWEWEQYYWCRTNTVHYQASGVCIRVILLNWWYLHWCTLLTWFLYYLFRIGHVNECPTMHCFINPRHTQSKIAYLWFWLGISGNSSEKLHCGNVINMSYSSWRRPLANSSSLLFNQVHCPLSSLEHWVYLFIH